MQAAVRFRAEACFVFFAIQNAALVAAAFL